jgi:hypothetical protein
MTLKFILILHLCSFAGEPNCFSSQYVAEFKDHYSCVQAGYAKAYESLSSLEIDNINKNRLAVKIECKEMEIT